jgi:predicted RNA-binding protein YlxR (DUF448 family)
MPAAGLVRFVVGPDAALVPDLAGRLPGRGLWVSADRDALARAAARNLFARAARRPVTVPGDLPGLVERLLAERVVAAVALARKAGLAICGHDKVKARLGRGLGKGPGRALVGALVEASDGAEQGKARLRPLARGAGLVSCLTAAELGLAFGRDSVIHAALDAGGITDRVLREAARLAGLRRAASAPAESAPAG